MMTCRHGTADPVWGSLAEPALQERDDTRYQAL